MREGMHACASLAAHSAHVGARGMIGQGDGLLLHRAGGFDPRSEGMQEQEQHDMSTLISPSPRDSLISSRIFLDTTRGVISKEGGGERGAAPRTRKQKI